MSSGIIALVLLGAFILLVCVGVPIGFALGLAGVLGLVMMDVTFMMFSQTIISGIDNFALLAIPFFVLLGSILEKSQISKALIDLADELIGFLPGGLAVGTVCRPCCSPRLRDRGRRRLRRSARSPFRKWKSAVMLHRFPWGPRLRQVPWGRSFRPASR